MQHSRHVPTRHCRTPPPSHDRPAGRRQEEVCVDSRPQAPVVIQKLWVLVVVLRMQGGSALGRKR